MRIALYARVSTTDQDCEMQLRELREYTERRGWTNTTEYVDIGISGAKASRPALDRLMADAAQRKFDCIVVYKIDRFGRSVLHLNQQLATLHGYGVRFIACSQPIDTDESNPASRLLLHILASVAEFEREIIRERVASGVKRYQTDCKAGTAKSRSGRNLPIGRPKRVFRRDEALQLRADGASWRTIAKQLGVPVTTVIDACNSATA